MSKYKIIFFGTSNFAVPALEALKLDKNFDIRLVVTQQDAPQGRKKILTPTSVKLAAEKLGLEIFTPEKIKDQKTLEIICGHEADFLVLAAYGKILPSKILTCSKYGAINVHPSLLPKYRGPSPVQYALLNGDRETGVSIIFMDEEIDHGPILEQQKADIDPNETADELKTRLSRLGGELLPKVLLRLGNNNLKPVPQDHKFATFSKILNREDGHINWNKSAEDIYNMWRAFYPWPGIFSEIKAKDLEARRLILTKIKLTEVAEAEIKNYKPGEIFIFKGNPFVRCGNGAIKILSLQLEGKKGVSAKEFLQGYKMFVGSSLT